MSRRLFSAWSQWVHGHRLAAVAILSLVTLGCLLLAPRSRVDNSLAVWQSETDRYWHHFQQFQEENLISDPLVIYLPDISRRDYTVLRGQLAQICECAVSGFLTAEGEAADKGLLLLRPSPDSPPEELDDLVERTRKVVNDSGHRFYLGGVWYVTAMLDRYSAQSVSLLFPVVVVVLWLGVWFFLRHTGNVLLVMGCGLVPATQIVGLLAFSGVKLNMVLLALPPMTMILGVAYSIHLAAKNAGSEPMARHQLFAATAVPCLLSALTTGLGFLSLTLSDYTPVRQLGVWGAVAALLALVNTLILLPSFYRPRASGLPLAFSCGSTTLLRRFRRSLLALFVALLAVAGFGLNRLTTGSLILDFFYPSAEVHQNYGAIEAAGLGLTPFEIDLSGSGLDNGRLSRELLDWAKTQPLITHFIYFFPEGQIVVQSTDRGMRLSSPSELSYITRPARRVTVLLKTVSSEQTFALAGALNSRLEKSFGTLPHPYVTGSVPLYTRGQNALFWSMATSFSCAFISVSLVIGVALRSWRYGLIAIIPNLLPVAFILAAMGWLGVPLSVSTMTVASIVFGIVVDDTIHFLHRLRSVAGSFERRLQMTLEHVGPAIIITSLVAGLGFAGFGASPFIPLRDFGLIISGALLLAMLCDLLLLPALLFTLEKD